MKRYSIIFFLLLLSASGFSQQNYEASAIPKELLAYSSSVIRNSELNIEVKALDNTIYHFTSAITVLNKNGDEAAHIAVFYDGRTVIKYIKGTIYDEFGKQIGKFTQSDFLDEGTTDGFSLFEDERVKHYVPPVTQYPYTVVYEYEYKSKQSLVFPDWHPYESPSASIEQSTYTITCPADFNIRYKEINLPSKVETGTNAAGLKTYTWHVNNLKAVRNEPFSPNSEAYLPSVKVAPEKFEYEKIKGSFNNWQELGKWNYDKLLMNRQNITAETAEHVKEITAGIDNPKLKAKKIYEYMQGKTHYISVQVGIGGYQPFLAYDVDKLNYGDCKGLVNYTQALLKQANIDSYYCVVEAGDKKVSMMKDFATMNQGDHVILCLPFKNDTTWLECTNQEMPFGYLGTFTDDRLVLACTPEGGKLMHTPKYDAANNLQVKKANFVINAAGELSGEIASTFKGTQYEKREYMIHESITEQKRVIHQVYPINNMDIEKLELKQDKGAQPVTAENIKLTARDYCAEDNGKYYFALNSIDRIGTPPREVRNRINDVYINDGYTNEDEISYVLPAGYHSTTTNYNFSVDKPFGNYKVSVSVKDGKLTYNRRLQIIDGTYSKNLYPEVVDFYRAVEDADYFKIVLVKN